MHESPYRRPRWGGLVAIVGRPNVGKSALFNRLMGQRVAIVEDLPGTTRDRLYGSVEWRGRTFSVVDTGGLGTEPKGQKDRPGRALAGGPRGRAKRARVGTQALPPAASLDEMRRAVRAQAEAAIEEADLVLLVVDAQSGLLAVEDEIADQLRRSGKRVLLVANKAESWRGEAQAHEFHALGLGAPHAVSALHGLGTGDLLDAILEALPEEVEAAPEAEARIAIVGRPNVGKSSLLNVIVGAERAVVDALPGTTRDPVDTLVERDGHRILLVDTAGLRRRGRITPGVEAFATLRTVRAIDRSDVAILLVDATEGVTAQDLHVAGYVLEAHKGLVIAVNKWDLVRRGERTTAEWRGRLREAFHFAWWAEAVFVSAKTGRNVDELLDGALAVARERRKRVPASELRRFLAEAVGKNPPPADQNRPVRFTHVLQSDVPDEPVFVFFVNHPAGVHFSYQRYLENELRRRFAFAGTPLRLIFRGGRGD